MRRCFVISPIGRPGSKIRRHADSVLTGIIRPAVDACGVSAFRSDQLDAPGRITDQMFKAIMSDDFCIAVLTGSNPNVYYETAVAQAAGKPVVMLLEDGRDLPFDIQDFRCIGYKLTDLEACKQQLIKYIRNLEANNWTSEGLLERYQRRAKRKSYFVLFPSLQDDPFYLRLLAGMSSNPTPETDMTFVTPSRAYSGSQFLEALDGLIVRQREFAAGLIAPTLDNVSARDLVDRINRFEIPLVLVDINPYGEAALPAKVCYVGFDNSDGARQAARAMSEAVGPDLRGRRILILGNEDQPDRHQSFLEAWAGDPPVVEFSPFDRAAARDIAARQISRSASEFHGIFGVSDEIAVGAVQAINDRKQSAIVIGFDGTSAATLLIDLKNSPLINTVVQDSYTMGEKAIAILKRQLTSQTVSKQKEILSGRMYV